MLRLAPNVRVALTTVMASTAPAGPSGPGPQIPASRFPGKAPPSAPEADMPTATAVLTMPDLRPPGRSRAVRRCGTWR